MKKTALATVAVLAVTAGPTIARADEPTTRSVDN